MIKTLSIKDETMTGKLLNELLVEVEKDSLSIKELIRIRVYKEVEDYNTRLPEYFKGLVKPRHAEKVLNGYRLKQKREIDPEKQYLIALAAFKKNGFFILINSFQAEDLNSKVYIDEATTVSFVKLTPLVGG